jgi:hypothetical protein
METEVRGDRATLRRMKTLKDYLNEALAKTAGDEEGAIALVLRGAHSDSQVGSAVLEQDQTAFLNAEFDRRIRAALADMRNREGALATAVRRAGARPEKVRRPQIRTD